MVTASELLLGRLKALADPARLRIVALCREGEVSVSELTDVLGQSQPRVSQHLKQLCACQLLERFRDGHFVYYRAANRGPDAATVRRLLQLLPAEEPQFARDLERLRGLRVVRRAPAPAADMHDRALNRALVELTVSAPLGDLIDIGCGQGRVLKLLASRARRAVGVDIDADARRFARAEMLLAGLENCTLRKGSMYALPFADDEFDTVILDDVLATAADPEAALREAARLLAPAGRLLLLSRARPGSAAADSRRFADWCADADLRLSPPRPIPPVTPRWLLAVATPVGDATAAA